MAAGADAFLVTVPGGLALVERNAPGVTLEIQQTQDGGNFGTLTLDNAPAEAIDGDPTDALDAAIMATSAYMFGMIDRAFAITLDYMKTREQFGHKIGSFQALQHRAADLQIQVLADPRRGQLPLPRRWTPSRARPRARPRCRAPRSGLPMRHMLVTRSCIQLHGGIGYTDAADIGLFLRKAMVLAPLYGSAGVHRARFRAVAPEQDDE